MFISNPNICLQASLITGSIKNGIQECLLSDVHNLKKNI
jgi:hypothetical protein